MTAAIAAALLVLAILDGAFSGFRSSVGRTGLVEHRHADRRANRRGAGLMTALLLPVLALAGIAAAIDHHRLAAFTRAGRAMLACYGPYAILVLAALAVYALLGWRQRYLASAIILGPFTLLRPVVAVTGAVGAVLFSRDLVVGLTAVLATVAVLACEPIADRLWYDQR